MKSPETTELSRIIRQRRGKILARRGWISLAIRLLFLALVLWILFSQVFLIRQLEGNDMYPAMKDGDLLIGYRLQSSYQNNQVVVYEHDGKTCAGRVVARENDYVTLDDSGKLYVNGSLQTGEILFPTLAREGTEYPLLVPEGSVFVLGDYRTQSTDSRDFGPLPLEEIQGKVISILRRRGL